MVLSPTCEDGTDNLLEVEVVLLPAVHLLKFDYEIEAWPPLDEVKLARAYDEEDLVCPEFELEFPPLRRHEVVQFVDGQH